MIFTPSKLYPCTQKLCSPVQHSRGNQDIKSLLRESILTTPGARVGQTSAGRRERSEVLRRRPRCAAAVLRMGCLPIEWWSRASLGPDEQQGVEQLMASAPRPPTPTVCCKAHTPPSHPPRTLISPHHSHPPPSQTHANGNTC